MARKEYDQSWVDMDRLSRIFQWLIVPILIFMLGMVFATAMSSELAASTIELSTVKIEGEPYTLSYPAQWNAAYDRQQKLFGDTLILPFTTAASILVLNDGPIRPIDGVSSEYVVTLEKVGADGREVAEAALADENGIRAAVTVSGATKAVIERNVSRTNDATGESETADHVVMSVGSDIYALDLVTQRGEADYREEMQIVLDSLSFEQ